jgi:(1->4)-alpha-D-glucan 1-alpha-D-glucosylmutase
MLRELRKQFNDDPRRLVNDLMTSWPDARIKLFATWRLMQLRREHSDLFKFGRYLPLNVEGALSQHLVAFARQFNSESAIVIVPRLVQDVQSLSQLSELTIELPTDLRASYVNVFTDESLQIELKSSAPAAAYSCFAPLPFTVLIST